ncbi:hypothetical protein IQ13_1134 [Lacibacter cauensis]|uniref:Uncharacterized protein n=1 Tax=Lacibacter cauensis TaxID=510947 RepID=A0A562SP74_9BACT|nr:hypothetical protein [Lacibacter cauensis]TWI83028.1 hypothetical protein IQ13_1134 [Lacibacter cauensis]
MNQKLLLLICITICCTLNVFAQKSTFTTIRPDLEKVINDYPNQFALIKGQQNQAEPNIIEYSSKVEMKGAVESKIIGYPANKKINWLWEAKLFVTADINTLKKQYKAYYNDILGKSLFSKGANNSIQPTNAYSAPSEELRLWSNQFHINDATGEFSKLVIDLIAEFQNFEWVVYLRVYDKEKDEEMRPSKDTNDPWRYGSNSNQ